jgi:hypothetical protein
MDWLTMRATGYDLFTPWAHLQFTLVATPEHDREHFREEAREWQKMSESFFGMHQAFMNYSMAWWTRAISACEPHLERCMIWTHLGLPRKT